MRSPIKSPINLNGPVLVIVGPTASGKSSLAIEVAKKYNGEIISADSRAIYKYVDIASAKPRKKDQQEITHWGIDLVGPEDFVSPLTTPFTAADFKKYALNKIKEIQQNGKLPVIVGGTGLYIDALIYDYNFGAEQKVQQQTDLNLNLKQRQIYHQMDIKELQEYCKINNVLVTGNINNKRHLERAIEKSTDGQPVVTKNKLIGNQYIVVGITTKKEELNTKIDQRIGQMIDQGLLKEYEKVRKLYHKDSEVMRSNAYRVAAQLAENMQEKPSMADFKSKLSALDRRLVKKQKTWFKRNEQIIWTDLENALAVISQKLEG